MTKQIELPSVPYEAIAVPGNVDWSQTDLCSLKGIHTWIKHIDGTLFLPPTIKSHVLGVMFIKGLRDIRFTTSFVAPTINQIRIPMRFPGRNPVEIPVDKVPEGLVYKQKQTQLIINRHLRGNRNPHECQEELIEAGLSEFAKA